MRHKPYYLELIQTLFFSDLHLCRSTKALANVTEKAKFFTPVVLAQTALDSESQVLPEPGFSVGLHYVFESQLLKIIALYRLYQSDIFGCKTHNPLEFDLVLQ